jgi:hypothetical protein
MRKQGECVSKAGRFDLRRQTSRCAQNGLETETSNARERLQAAKSCWPGICASWFAAHSAPSQIGSSQMRRSLHQEKPGKDEKSLRRPARLDQLDEGEPSTLTSTKARPGRSRSCSSVSDESIPGVLPGRWLLPVNWNRLQKSFHQGRDCNRQFISYDILCLFPGALDPAG